MTKKKGKLTIKLSDINDEFDTLVIDLEIAQRELVMSYWLNEEQPQDED